MGVDGPTAQFLALIFAVFFGPKILSMLPSMDPLVIIMGVFIVAGLVQRLSLEDGQRGEGSGPGGAPRRARQPARGRAQEEEDEASASAGGGRAKSAEELLVEAERAMKQNGYERAAALASRATDMDPESVKAWEILASAQKWQGLREEAAATVKKAHDIYEVESEVLRKLEKELAGTGSPVTDAKARSEKGDGFLAQRQYDLAFECYGQALESLEAVEVAEEDKPFCLQIRRHHAACAQQLQDWGACRRSATVVLDHDPNDQPALLQRAAANEALEKFSAALADARKLLSLDPKSAAANRIVHNCQQALRD